MELENGNKIKISVFSVAGFIVVSYLIFRSGLPKNETIFLYNIIIILSLQNLGFYRGLFFLAMATALTILASLGIYFGYIWNVPVFFMVFFIVNGRIKKRDYYGHIVKTRIEEVKENTNLLADEYARHKREALSLEKKEEKYRLLEAVTSILSSTLSMDMIAGYILNSALNIIGKSDAALLFLVDTKKQELNLFASKTGGLEKVKAKKGDILDEWAFKQRQCLIVEDIKKDFRFSEKRLDEYSRPFRSVISCPLIAEKKVIGMVRLEHARPYNYTSEDLRLLDILCDLGAVSLRNAEFYKQTLDLAITDGLTGLYLRRFFLDRLKEEIARSLRNELDCSFLMIDVDNFKSYNDKYGHVAGDIVLRALSETLKTFSDKGVICRYGGEEFSMFLPETSKLKALAIAESIRNAIKAETIDLRRVKTNVTISIGVANFPQDAKLVDMLIQKADERLYAAKREGKDRVCF